VAKVKQGKGIRSGGATRPDASPRPRLSSSPPGAGGGATKGRTAAAGSGSKSVATTKRADGTVARGMKQAARNGKGDGVRSKAGRAGSSKAVRGVRAPAGQRTTTRKVAPMVASSRGSRAPAVPDRVVKIKQLDPYEKCGPSTSVVHLYRVDESLDGLAATHLVFYDRHGWYCEHGRGCRAVEDVRKVVKLVPGKTLARTI
jgi:hypothetical protein